MIIINIIGWVKYVQSTMYNNNLSNIIDIRATALQGARKRSPNNVTDNRTIISKWGAHYE